MWFQLGFLLALPLGYFLCIGQAKLTLAIYRRSPAGRREEADRLHAAWVGTPVDPSSFYGDGPAVAGRWNTPGYPPRPSPAACEPLSLSHPELIRTELCPEGFSAKDILPRVDDHGFPRAALYPGGLHAWYRDHGWPYDSEKVEVDQ